METTTTMRYDATAIATSEADAMLDQMVHEYVMGNPKPKQTAYLPAGVEKHGWVLAFAHGAGYAPSWCAPRYSSDATLFWRILERLQQEGFWVSVSTSLGTDQIHAKVSEPDAGGGVLAPWPQKHESTAQSGPLAVCRAALLAKLSADYPGCAT